MDIIWIQSDLDGNDKILLEAIAKYKELSMKDLQAEYERIMDKGTLSYMVKLVDKLEKMNLIVTKKSGRVKYISLNEIGENMILNKSLKTELLNKLN